MTQRDDSRDELVIPLVSEEASIAKRVVMKGLTRIHVLTDSVEETFPAELSREDVEVRHVAVNRYLEAGEEKPQIRTEGEVVIVPVLEEVAVIEKRLYLREELHIHRHITAHPTEIPVTLRRQRAVIEAEDGVPPSEPTET